MKFSKQGEGSGLVLPNALPMMVISRMSAPPQESAAPKEVTAQVSADVLLHPWFVCLVSVVHGSGGWC